mmetsp:Transcript_112062/g.302392  ORF Transcript_112062/g.302392 Transcript_112062/m.302392 type:complete len:91 (-) Transcript_112062:343-615(-)
MWVRLGLWEGLLPLLRRDILLRSFLDNDDNSARHKGSMQFVVGPPLRGTLVAIPGRVKLAVRGVTSALSNSLFTTLPATRPEHRPRQGSQ